MTIRDFLRGGYLLMTDITLVTRHGLPIFTVTPGILTKNPMKSPEIVEKSTRTARKPKGG